MSEENCIYPSDPNQHCYYHEPSVCTNNLWQCQTCNEWFCSYHWHETAKGRNVECAACEYNRQEYGEENKYFFDRAQAEEKILEGYMNDVTRWVLSKQYLEIYAILREFLDFEQYTDEELKEFFSSYLPEDQE